MEYTVYNLMSDIETQLKIMERTVNMTGQKAYTDSEKLTIIAARIERIRAIMEDY